MALSLLKYESYWVEAINASYSKTFTLDFAQSRNRKFSSLLMTLAERMGLRLDRFGDSTEQLDI